MYIPNRIVQISFVYLHQCWAHTLRIPLLSFPKNRYLMDSKLDHVLCCSDYQTCTKEMDCSETCVRAYFKRYASRCAGGREQTCEVNARIHNGGPRGCRREVTLGYWGRVERCCGSSDCTSAARSSKSSILVYWEMVILVITYYRSRKLGDTFAVS